MLGLKTPTYMMVLSDGEVTVKVLRQHALRHVGQTLVGLALLVPAPLRLAAQERIGNVDWICVGGDRGHQRYSPLRQINRANVQRLEVAWTYHTGELQEGEGKTIECTPLVVDGVIYVTTGRLKVVALDAATGKQKWRFDPFAAGPATAPLASGGVNRGLAYWSDGRLRGERRIIHGTADGRLFSIDPSTGRLDGKFGQRGVVDLRAGLERDLTGLAYGPTSAPAIYRDLIILGVSNGEGPGPVAPGDVRAFDVRTGEQLWRFHTVPRPGEAGNETWQAGSWRERGAANAWPGVTVDEQRGMAFVALGSAAFDFYGADRKGQNLFANCVVALDAQTGRRRWHFQAVHHDIWDHDLPAPPNLVTVTHDRKRIDAVAQVTKTGYVFLLNRVTGEPLFEVREQPVPQSDVPGEQSWPTQPVPVKPPPFARQFFREDDITNRSKQARDEVLERFSKLRPGLPFSPPSLQGTVVVPGLLGGANWSGASFDPTRSVLYVNSNNLPNIITLVKARRSSHGYDHTGYVRFFDQDGYPAIQPPWGNLTAIDLNRGEFLWQVPLGEYAELTAQGVPQTGTENLGGTIVTAGGLVFIGATRDEKFRAFDKSTGKVLWEHALPAGGYATPCTYQSGGKQYVVIAAGGAGHMRTRAGDAFVAFALP